MNLEVAVRLNGDTSRGCDRIVDVALATIEAIDARNGGFSQEEDRNEWPAVLRLGRTSSLTAAIRKVSFGH